MKIKTILIAALLSVSGLTQAQVDRDAFEKAVDFVNCKTVEFSLKGKLDILQKYQQNCSCKDGAANTEISNFLSSVGGYEATISLSNEIELLKKQFNKNWKAEDEVIFLTENIFADQTKYQKLYSFADKRKNDSGFATFKSDLRKELPAILAKQLELSNPTQSNTDSKDLVKPLTLEERVSVLEQRSEPKVEENGWLDGFSNYLAILAIIVSIVAIIVTFSKRSRGAETNNKEIDDTYNSIINKILSGRRFGEFIQSELNRRINQRDIVDSVINKFSPEITKLIEEKSESKPTMEWNFPSQHFPHKDESKQPESKAETFFLSTPNSDGSFNDSSVSINYKEGASIYRFTKVGNNRAMFQIDEREASVKLALTYPDKSIDPVCDAVNAFNPKAKLITTVEFGEAELLNDKWVVNKSQKAKIRYES